MYTYDYQSKGYNIKDGFYARVVGNCRKGVFLETEDNVPAFAYFNFLPIGTEVFCTLIRQAKEQFSMLVSVDSVTSYAEYA